MYSSNTIKHKQSNGQSVQCKSTPKWLAKGKVHSTIRKKPTFANHKRDVESIRELRKWTVGR